MFYSYTTHTSYCIVFVLTFIGDQLATAAVDRLREEVTGVLGEALPGRGDSDVLNLTSGGGTFTGYGLAAAQLVRLKVRTVIYFELLLNACLSTYCTSDRSYSRRRYRSWYAWTKWLQAEAT